MAVRLLVVLAVTPGAAGLALAAACDPLVDADYVGESGGKGDVEICDRGPAPDEDNCTSEVKELGLLCTTCPGKREVCRPAQCWKAGRCLECVDPAGRTGIDCCKDYLEVDLARWAFEGTSTLNSCHVIVGVSKGAGATCHYPSGETCGPVGITPGRGDDIDPNRPYKYVCRYADRTSRSVMVNAGEQPPNPLNGRPSLPEPGSDCWDEDIPELGLTCTKCTFEDESAVMSCHFPRPNACARSSSDDPFKQCVSCLSPSGSTIDFCDPHEEP